VDLPAARRTHYATGGWSVGAVALVAGWLARTLPANTKVAAIFPDGPQRYLGTVYDDDYCAAHGLLGSPPPVEPEVIGRLDEKEVTHWSRCTTVVDPLTLSDPAPDDADTGAVDTLAQSDAPEEEGR
jgi:hypothetical protein